MTDRVGPRRIVVTGSESTGKTTLAIELARRLRAPCVPEFARRYAEQHPGPLTIDDVGPIATGQMDAEDIAAATLLARPDAPQLLVLDTDLVSTVVYSHHYYGSCPQWIIDAARTRLGDLYLLSTPDLPWTPDNVRNRPASRHEIHELFHEWLRRFGVPTSHLSSSGAERLDQALRAAIAHGLTPTT